MTNFERFLDTFFKWPIIVETTPAILSGMLVTLLIGIAVVVTGILLGLFLAILRSYRLAVLSWPIIIFADIMRALPPLVLVLLFFFGLPNVGLSLSGFTVLWLVLSLTLAAFAEEIFWAGITSVRKGQWDAARASGLTATQTLAYIIMPQAVRITIPPLTNRTIAIVKNTALGTVIGVPEILNQATTAVSFAGNATPLTLGALAYLILFLPVVILGRWIETRFAWKRA